MTREYNVPRPFIENASPSFLCFFLINKEGGKTFRVEHKLDCQSRSNVLVLFCLKLFDYLTEIFRS